MPEITYKIAHAAATDAGNHAMRSGGRTVWSFDDYGVCIAEFRRLMGSLGQESAEELPCACLPIHCDRWPRPWMEDLAQAWWDGRDAISKRCQYPGRLWTTDAWRALDGGERDHLTVTLCNAGLVNDSRDCAVHGVGPGEGWPTAKESQC